MIFEIFGWHEVCVTCAGANFGQRAAAGRGVADGGVPAMVNDERVEAREAEDLASRQEPAPKAARRANPDSCREGVSENAGPR
jgi:hypothetical protein